MNIPSFKQAFFAALSSLPRVIAKNALAFAKAHKIITAVVVVAIFIGGGALIRFVTSVQNESPDQKSSVTLVRIGDIGSAEPLSIVGEVRSTSEATVAADASGMVQGVYKSLGDYATAGSIIAELENARERAAVAQAKASFEKTKSNVSITGIGLDSANNSLQSAKESARNVIESAHATIDDAVHKKADSVFSNPNGSQPHFSVNTSNSQLVLNAETNRLAVQTILLRTTSANETNSDTDSIFAELQTLQKETATVRDFLSSVTLALNNAIPSGTVSEATIASYRTDANTALSTINALRTTISSTIENLKLKEASVTISEKNLSQDSPADNADIALAQASLDGARANLEKTFVRAPISGTINAIKLERGNFVSFGSPVLTIANNGALEIVGYIADLDRSGISAGQTVTINGTARGVITRIAPALDPVTKRIEIRIGITDGQASLSNGASVRISIPRTPRATTNTPDEIRVPISALKITPEGSKLFTLSETHTLVGHTVVTGDVVGDKVLIKEGATADMFIVLDARGLKEGQDVAVTE